MRVLGEIRYEYEPDIDGSDEYQILDEIEKSQKDSDDDMSSEYINNRFEELGVEENTKVRIIPVLVVMVLSQVINLYLVNIIFQLKEYNLLKKKKQFTYTFDLDF